MDYENYKLCKIIDAIDIVINHIHDPAWIYSDKLKMPESVENITFIELLDLRNDLEKQIWLNNQNDKKNESHN